VSRAYCCDRCDTLFEGDPRKLILDVSSRDLPDSTRADNDSPAGHHWDLCPPCARVVARAVKDVPQPIERLPEVRALVREARHYVEQALTKSLSEQTRTLLKRIDDELSERGP
jgi:hypothetical protein